MAPTGKQKTKFDTMKPRVVSQEAVGVRAEKAGTLKGHATQSRFLSTASVTNAKSISFFKK
jgi:hypothetical protein